MTESASNLEVPQFAAGPRMRFGALPLLSVCCTRLDYGGIAG